jgi:hypothetical protein
MAEGNDDFAGHSGIAAMLQAKRQQERHEKTRERTHLLFLYSSLCQVSDSGNVLRDSGNVQGDSGNVQDDSGNVQGLGIINYAFAGLLSCFTQLEYQLELVLQDRGNVVPK